MINKEVLTYDYYISGYKGSLIPFKEEFEKAKGKAVEYFNYKVGNNTVVINLEEPRDRYRDCLCALSERIYEIEHTYASEGLGSWNVSYNEYANDPKLRQTFVSYIGTTGAASTWL